MKKLLIIALVSVGFLLTSAPKSEARVFVNIGFGAPFGYYPYYPAYYGYGYYPYRYGYYGRGPYYGGYRPYYWNHGRRIYYRPRCW